MAAPLTINHKPSALSHQPLFRPQRFNRSNAGSTASGKVARQHRGRRQHDGGGRQRDRIERADAVQQAADLSRWIQRLLYGVTATDPATFSAGVGMLLAVTLLACCMLRGATRVAPTWRFAQSDQQVCRRRGSASCGRH